MLFSRAQPIKKEPRSDSHYMSTDPPSLRSSSSIVKGEHSCDNDSSKCACCGCEISHDIDNEESSSIIRQALHAGDKEVEEQMKINEGLAEKIDEILCENPNHDFDSLQYCSNVANQRRSINMSQKYDKIQKLQLQEQYLLTALIGIHKSLKQLEIQKIESADPSGISSSKNSTFSIEENSF